jgi:thymidine kinase
VIVEEAQFTTGLQNFVSQELAKDKDIILVGLHGDYLQRPFRDCISGRAEFLECISQADDIVYLKSLCNVCRDGSPGQFTKRLTLETEVVVVGSHDA